MRAIPSNGLTKAQQSELESARRRAAKALAGKAANAAVSRRATRRVEEDDDDDVSPEEAAHMQNEEIEAKLANITDAKEAKRLKRCFRRLSVIGPFPQPAFPAAGPLMLPADSAPVPLY